MPNETTRCRNVFDKKTANFLLHPPPMSLDIHSAIYFYLCISVDKAKQNEINLVATYPVKITDGYQQRFTGPCLL